MRLDLDELFSDFRVRRGKQLELITIMMYLQLINIPTLVPICALAN